jgi:integrase
MAIQTRTKREKPNPPYPGFPLKAHPGGSWVKRWRGKDYSFGGWSDPQKALERYQREWPYILKGERPPAFSSQDGCTLQFLVNSFLEAKERAVRSGELSIHSWRDYHRTGKALVTRLGRDRLVSQLGPSDFASYRQHLAASFPSPVTIGNEVNRARILFHWAAETRLIPQAVHFGPDFEKPKATVVRKYRREGGKKLFTRDEILTILAECSPQLRAMVLLGINGGLGPSDCGRLPLTALDLKTGWLDYPRGKTEIERKIPLWKETLAALSTATQERPSPKRKEDAGLIFLTRYGRPWTRDGEVGEDLAKGVAVNAVTLEFKKILQALGINGRRGLGFYSLRHTFQTIGDESKDFVAVKAIMGHADHSMSGVYREEISDERLKAVVQVVHDWLYPPQKVAKGRKAK